MDTDKLITDHEYVQKLESLLHKHYIHNFTIGDLPPNEYDVLPDKYIDVTFSLWTNDVVELQFQINSLQSPKFLYYKVMHFLSLVVPSELR